ncbi:MAG: hypothetical protein WBN94_05140 [Methanothrix sp.]
MRFNYLCLCLLSLILGAGAAGAAGEQGFSLQQSIDVAGGAFSEDYVNSLFGISGMGTELSSSWFGPEFENTSSASSFLSEFYINTSVPVIGFNPVKIDVTHKMPSKIYFGSGREVTYTQYQSTIAAARGNELWIQKGLDWSAYAIVPAGTGMQFIAFAPAGGQADYYEIVQTDSLNITSKRVNFYTGYNSLNFRADKVGRHVLLFVLNNQPSNSIVVDVISQAPTAQQTTTAGQMQPTSDMPPAYNQPNAGQTTTSGLFQTTTSASTQYQTYGTSYPTQTAVGGDTPVTIQSQGMRGYQVFLDEVLIGTEGTGGDAPDGKFSFNVIGNQNHNIRVYDGQFNYPKSMYFQRGVLKIINVEAGTAVYL